MTIEEEIAKLKVQADAIRHVKHVGVIAVVVIAALAGVFVWLEARSALSAQAAADKLLASWTQQKNAGPTVAIQPTTATTAAPLPPVIERRGILGRAAGSGTGKTWTIEDVRAAVAAETAAAVKAALAKNQPPPTPAEAACAGLRERVVPEYLPPSAKDAAALIALHPDFPTSQFRLVGQAHVDALGLDVAAYQERGDTLTRPVLLDPRIEPRPSWSLKPVVVLGGDVGVFQSIDGRTWGGDLYAGLEPARWHNCHLRVRLGGQTPGGGRAYGFGTVGTDCRWGGD